MVRVRTAPSPTGVPHIGNTWAALFNFLWARKNNGKFILRVEDTDQARIIPGSLTKIYETLKWLGLEYDEGPDVGGEFGPYIQSERKEIYKKCTQELVDKGFAYDDNGAVRFQTEKGGRISWIDLVGNKNIEFENASQEDFVILKSDGFPTYHLANVVDDHLMRITHVIRGSEWISSTPKHIALYAAFGWDLPKFAHLPLILGEDKSKLSKRHGAKSVLEFRDEGFLREALLNFMILLGWTPPSGREILTLEDMIREFDLKDVNLSSPIFDSQKLLWMNGEYIRKAENSKLKSQIYEFYSGKYAGEIIEPTIPIVKERMKTLKDYEGLAEFFFRDINPGKKLFSKSSRKHLEVALGVVKGSEWKMEVLQKLFLSAVDAHKFKTGDFFMSLRGAVASSRITPPIVESIIILGKEKTISRIEKALKLLDQ